MYIYELANHMERDLMIKISRTILREIQNGHNYIVTGNGRVNKKNENQGNPQNTRSPGTQNNRPGQTGCNGWSHIVARNPMDRG